MPFTPRAVEGRGLYVVALLLLAGCAPRLIWSGRDSQRRLTAEVYMQGAEQWLRTGETPGPRFEAVGTEGLAFSPDGRRVAYPALREGRWLIIFDGQALGPYDGVADVLFSRDGARLAFLAQSADGWRAVVDGVAAPAAFESIQSRTLQFSPDGAHFGFVGVVGKCARVVVDGVAGECVERVLSMRVTNSGTVAVVLRERGKDIFVPPVSPGVAERSGEARPSTALGVNGANPARPSTALGVNGTGRPSTALGVNGTFDTIGEWVVTDAGDRFAFAAQVGARQVVVVDGVVSADCARVRHLRFGDDGKRVAWVCADGGLARVVLDGELGRAFPVVSAPVLAAHAPDVAFVAREALGAWVIAADASWGPFAEVLDLVVANRGGGLAFIARADGVTRVVHRDRQTPLEAVVEGSLVLSDDGAHWAAIAGDPAKRELWLTIDGARGRPVAPGEVFGEASPNLSPWLARELREALAAPIATTRREPR